MVLWHLLLLQTQVVQRLVDAEPKYLTSDTFNKAINTGVVIVEFVASFAEPFSEWEAIEDGEYYRVDIEKYPDLKKKYKVRSIPTIMVFSNGAKELTYRANIMLDVRCDSRRDT